MENNKLPANFSEMVMHSINAEIARREKRDERIMYSAIIGVIIVSACIVAYLAHLYGWFSHIKEWFNFSAIGTSISNTAGSFSSVWIIVFVNSLLLIGLFSYITNKKEKEFTQHV